MQTERVKLYNLGYGQLKSYLVSILFVLGNIALPQICHLIPNGGLMLLPIYFFTLVGAYKYGWRVGVMIALFSPLVNHLLFGMPSAPMLTIILVKSLLLAFAASFAARRVSNHAVWVFVAVVASYQIVGTLIQWALVGDLYLALQDFRIGAIGMAIQVVGGYLLIKRFSRA